ncbi:class I tRNA ligase family protein, partial [Rhizobium ruizarguesonis]
GVEHVLVTRQDLSRLEVFKQVLNIGLHRPLMREVVLEQTPELARYYPTNVLVTGFDIIPLWVVRMMQMGLHFMKDENGDPVEPF